MRSYRARGDYRNSLQSLTTVSERLMKQEGTNLTDIRDLYTRYRILATRIQEDKSLKDMVSSLTLSCAENIVLLYGSFKTKQSSGDKLWLSYRQMGEKFGYSSYTMYAKARALAETHPNLVKIRKKGGKHQIKITPQNKRFFERKPAGKKIRSQLLTYSPQEVREIIEKNLSLVEIVAKNMIPRLTSSVELAELINMGFFGLLDAVDTYNPSKVANFRTYAEFRIRGAILDELRALDWTPRIVREESRDDDLARQQLAGGLGREPTDEEVAAQRGMSLENYLRRREQSISLIIPLEGIGSKTDNMNREGASTWEKIISDPNPMNNPENLSHTKETNELLWTCVGKLPFREQLIIRLYYQHDLVMKEIGQILGLTESRIFQKHSNAIGRLKNIAKDMI